MADFGSVLTKRKLDQIQDETQFLFNKKIKADKNTCIDGNYSFSDLPPEILHYILSFITSDSQRRHIRSVCQSWFDHINYNEFNIGLLLTSESEEFSRCFGRYQKPFGLKFMKIGKLINMEYIRDKNKNLMLQNYLYQSMLKPLTQLTALDLRLKNFEVPQELINIQFLTIRSPIRGSTISKLTNLRRLKTDSQIAEIPTTLESLDLSEKDQIDTLTIDSTYSRLTELAISTTTRCDFPDALTNLRKISLFEYNGLAISGTKVNLTNFPNLEEYNIITNVNTEELPDQYPSTLTKLHVLSYGDVKINESLTQLKDLDCFAVKLPNYSHTRMRFLEDYVVQSNNETILQHLDSQKITTLRITLGPENCRIWKNFTNLIDLDLGMHWLPNDVLVPLTRLTKLNLYYANYPQQWMTELPNLVDLKLMKAPGANDSESINFEAMNQLTLLELRQLQKHQYHQPYEFIALRYQ